MAAVAAADASTDDLGSSMASSITVGVYRQVQVAEANRERGERAREERQVRASSRQFRSLRSAGRVSCAADQRALTVCVMDVVKEASVKCGATMRAEAQLHRSSAALQRAAWADASAQRVQRSIEQRRRALESRAEAIEARRLSAAEARKVAAARSVAQRATVDASVLDRQQRYVERRRTGGVVSQRKSIVAPESTNTGLAAGEMTAGRAGQLVRAASAPTQLATQVIATGAAVSAQASAQAIAPAVASALEEAREWLMQQKLASAAEVRRCQREWQSERERAERAAREKILAGRAIRARERHEASKQRAFFQQARQQETASVRASLRSFERQREATARVETQRRRSAHEAALRTKFVGAREAEFVGSTAYGHLVLHAGRVGANLTASAASSGELGIGSSASDDASVGHCHRNLATDEGRLDDDDGPLDDDAAGTRIRGSPSGRMAPHAANDAPPAASSAALGAAQAASVTGSASARAAAADGLQSCGGTSTDGAMVATAAEAAPTDGAARGVIAMPLRKSMLSHATPRGKATPRNKASPRKAVQNDASSARSATVLASKASHGHPSAASDGGSRAAASSAAPGEKRRAKGSPGRGVAGKVEGSPWRAKHMDMSASGLEAIAQRQEATAGTEEALVATSQLPTLATKLGELMLQGPQPSVSTGPKPRRAAASTAGTSAFASGTRVDQLFRALDKNGDGKVSKMEWRVAMRSTFGDAQCPVAEVDALFAELDSNGDGDLALAELAGAVRQLKSRAQEVASIERRAADRAEYWRARAEETRDAARTVAEWEAAVEELATLRNSPTPEVRLGMLLARKGLKPADLLARLDADRSGRLSVDEFTEGVLGLGIESTEEEIAGLFSSLDGDGTGELDYRELTEAVGHLHASKMEAQENERRLAKQVLVLEKGARAAQNHIWGLLEADADAKADAEAKAEAEEGARRAARAAAREEWRAKAEAKARAEESKRQDWEKRISERRSQQGDVAAAFGTACTAADGVSTSASAGA